MTVLIRVPQWTQKISHPLPKEYHDAMPDAGKIVSTQVKIGMEVHVELATRSKMFTSTPNIAHPDYYDAEPNSLVDPVVAALPGTLPVMNRRAVEMSMMVGLALNCSIASRTTWDRKNYYYPDLPKGYQISQYDQPLCRDGWLEIYGTGGDTVRIGIIRAHLEEDTGKLLHELPGGMPCSGSLLDLNRAGTPLLEIVTEPDFQHADDAVAFGRDLRNICRFLGVTEGIMQRGHMRFEPNINMIITLDDGEEVLTPIAEVKNLNSFRALGKAIRYEEKRQVDAWIEDGRTMGPGAKSTLGWDAQEEITVLQRTKEDAHDYRYFPEPDLPPLTIPDSWKDALQAALPELPASRCSRYRAEYGIEQKDALALTDDLDTCLFFESCVTVLHTRLDEVSLDEAAAGFTTAKLLLNNCARRANEQGCLICKLGITPEGIAAIIVLRDTGCIGSRVVDDLLALLCTEDGDPLAIAENHDLLLVRTPEKLDAWIEKAIIAQPEAVQDFREGKDAAIGRLVGEIMRLSGGQADARQVQDGLRARLESG